MTRWKAPEMPEPEPTASLRIVRSTIDEDDDSRMWLYGVLPIDGGFIFVEIEARTMPLVNDPGRYRSFSSADEAAAFLLSLEEKYADGRLVSR